MQGEEVPAGQEVYMVWEVNSRGKRGCYNYAHGEVEEQCVSYEHMWMVT